MTTEEVRALVDKQSKESTTAINDHRLNLGRALIRPREISVIARQVENGRVRDEVIDVWLVAEESSDGYKIVMRHDGLQFGLASNGFSSDKHLVLCGWYGDQRTAFLSM